MTRIIDFLRTRPYMEPRLCEDCGTCVESCPVEAIDRHNKTIDYEKCIECLCRHEMCMYQAVKLHGTNPVARVFTKLMRL